jgi:hypothetical protein
MPLVTTWRKTVATPGVLRHRLISTRTDAVKAVEPDTPSTGQAKREAMRVLTAMAGLRPEAARSVHSSRGWMGRRTCRQMAQRQGERGSPHERRYRHAGTAPQDSLSFPGIVPRAGCSFAVTASAFLRRSMWTGAWRDMDASQSARSEGVSTKRPCERARLFETLSRLHFWAGFWPSSLPVALSQYCPRSWAPLLNEAESGTSSSPGDAIGSAGRRSRVGAVPRLEAGSKTAECLGPKLLGQR